MRLRPAPAAPRLPVRAADRLRADSWSDAEMLRLLDLRAQGKTAAQIAIIFGRSRSAVLGIEKRIRDDLEASGG